MDEKKKEKDKADLHRVHKWAAKPEVWAALCRHGRHQDPEVTSLLVTRRSASR